MKKEPVTFTLTEFPDKVSVSVNNRSKTFDNLRNGYGHLDCDVVASVINWVGTLPVCKFFGNVSCEYRWESYILTEEDQIKIESATCRFIFEDFNKKDKLFEKTYDEFDVSFKNVLLDFLDFIEVKEDYFIDC